MIEQRCKQLAGFMLEQDCKRQADAFCNSCQKPVCLIHSRILNNGIFCLDCTQLETERNPQANVQQRGQQEGEEGTDYSYDDDPYFYTYRSYPGYRRHDSEFTDADRADFVTSEGNVGEFEQDFDGS